MKPKFCRIGRLTALVSGLALAGALHLHADPRGNLIYCDWANDGGLYSSRLEDWEPKKVMEGIRCARYSLDGKLIGLLDKNKMLHVMFSDFSGKVEIGSGSNPGHSEAWNINWVKNGKWGYELSYGTGNAIHSFEIKVQGDKISVGEKRQIAKDMNGRKSKGINGAFYAIGNNVTGKMHVLARTSWRTQMHTLPSPETVARWNDAYMWKEPSGAVGDLQHCHPTLSRDGDWIAMVQHGENEPNGYYTGLYPGSHTGIVLQKWMKPGDPMPKDNSDKENYILIGSEPMGTPTGKGSPARISYHWTNHPRFLVASGEIDKQVYLLELKSYPPKRASISKPEGDYKWHKFATSGLAKAPFGMDFWIEDGVENKDWNDGTSWKGYTMGGSTGLAPGESLKPSSTHPVLMHAGNSVLILKEGLNHDFLGRSGNRLDGINSWNAP